MITKQVREVIAKRLVQAQRHHLRGFISGPQVQELRRFAQLIEKDLLELERENASKRPQ